MTLFQQMNFKFILIAFQAAYALQIEAPSEISEQIFAYAQEIGVKNDFSILRANIEKNKECNTFTLKLINQTSGKTIKEVQYCSSELPNIALQNAVLELFGHKTEHSEKPLIQKIGVPAIMAIFAASGLVLYYTKPPKPVEVIK